MAAIVLCCGLSMNATSGLKKADPAPALHAPGFAWNFIYAFGSGPSPGLSWSGDYLYISSGSYLV